MCNGQPEPKVDISDFPQILRNAGGEFGEDFDGKFPDSIALN